MRSQPVNKNINKKLNHHSVISDNQYIGLDNKVPAFAGINYIAG